MTTPLTLTPADAAAILAAVDGTLAEGSMAVAALREYVAANPAPEWTEGTIAWVRLIGQPTEFLLQRREGVWFDGSGEGTGAAYFRDSAVISVRPLRVLGDDEVAVKRVGDDLSGAEWRSYATRLAGRYAAAFRLAHAYADALDAEVSR